MKKTSSTPTTSTSSLISQVAERDGRYPKKFFKEAISAFLGAIADELRKGQKMRVDNLGIFQVKDRAARMGRNPQTGEEIRIPASKKISYRAAKQLKEMVGIKKSGSSKKVAPKKKK